MKSKMKKIMMLLVAALFALTAAQCADGGEGGGGGAKRKIKNYETEIVKPKQDKWQAMCSTYDDNIPGDKFQAFIKAQKALIKYPGGDPKKIVGDSKRGEKVYTNKKKGNCVACHCGHPKPELVACGNLGTSHKNYATKSNQKPEYTYGKIYNSWSVLPCSAMFRSGVHKILTPQEVADITAYLHDKNSTMNK